MPKSPAVDIETEVERQETTELFRATRLAQVANVVIAGLLAYALISLGVPAAETITWWSIVLLVAAIRLELVRRFRRAEWDDQALRRWRQRHVLATAVIGLVWGVGTTWLVWSAPTRAAQFVGLVLGGMVAGAIPILASVLAAFRVYALVVCVPFIAGMLHKADSPLSWSFVLMCLVFLLTALVNGDSLHEKLGSAIRLGIEKTRLLSELSAHGEELAKSNEELRRSLEQLREAQDQLIESEKMAALGGLVAVVAHEINTPVGVAVTAASALEERSTRLATRYRDGEMTRSDLERYLLASEESSQMIVANLQRAATLVQSFKQVVIDQSTEVKRHFNLRAYLEETMASLQPVLDRVSVHCQIDCPADIEIEGFPGVLSQIITNLVTNAVVHGLDESPGGAVRIVAAKLDDQLKIEFSDNGKGVSADNLGKIFEPFFTTKRGAGGSGLGLHIVYNLVTQTLRGTIACRSTPGQGTTFAMAWPLIA